MCRGFGSRCRFERRTWRAPCATRTRRRRSTARRSTRCCSGGSKECWVREVLPLDAEASIAAIILDNRDRRVLAYAGSADFGAVARRGTIDMARAVRSPGSALKPFIYAMAFDRLLIHPETLLEDRPRQFGDYAPSDFDGHFQGDVTARQALQYSLNVPAVAVLDRLGPARFTAALAAAGSRCGCRSRPPIRVWQWRWAAPALPSSIWCASMRPSPTREGWRRCAIAATIPPLRQARSLAAGDWYVNDILAEAPPPPGVLPAELRHGRRLAFKTGTSYGYRDFWAVGYDAEVTIGVWAGRLHRHPDAGAERPADRGADPLQASRPSGSSAAPQRNATAPGSASDCRAIPSGAPAKARFSCRGRRLRPAGRAKDRLSAGWRLDRMARRGIAARSRRRETTLALARRRKTLCRQRNRAGRSTGSRKVSGLPA